MSTSATKHLNDLSNTISGEQIMEAAQVLVDLVADRLQPGDLSKSQLFAIELLTGVMSIDDCLDEYQQDRLSTAYEHYQRVADEIRDELYQRDLDEGLVEPPELEYTPIITRYWDENGEEEGVCFQDEPGGITDCQ